MLLFYMGLVGFSHHYAIGAYGETGDYVIINKQSANKLLAALKR